MSELKPGVIALVYGLKNDLEHNGKSVELIMLRTVTDSEEKCWMVRGNMISKYGEEGIGYFWSKNLLPIDGKDFSHEDERQKELVNG